MTPGSSRKRGAAEVTQGWVRKGTESVLTQGCACDPWTGPGHHGHCQAEALGKISIFFRRKGPLPLTSSFIIQVTRETIFVNPEWQGWKSQKYFDRSTFPFLFVSAFVPGTFPDLHFCSRLSSEISQGVPSLSISRGRPCFSYKAACGEDSDTSAGHR